MSNILFTLMAVSGSIVALGICWIGCTFLWSIGHPVVAVSGGVFVVSTLGMILLK